MSSIRKQPISVTDGVKVVRLNVAAGGSVPEHHSNVDVVATIIRGSGDFTVAGQPRAVTAGDVIVMRPLERHSITASSDLEIVVVHARVAHAGAPASCGA